MFWSYVDGYFADQFWDMTTSIFIKMWLRGLIGDIVKLMTKGFISFSLPKMTLNNLFPITNFKSTMAISPGIHFIGRTLAHVFLSCLVTWAILFSISDRLGSISKPSLFLLSITLYLLGVFVAKPLVDDHRNSRMAKALGATLPPRVDRGVLKKSRENFETGYPGEFGGFLIWRKLKLVL